VNETSYYPRGTGASAETPARRTPSTVARLVRALVYGAIILVAAAILWPVHAGEPNRAGRIQLSNVKQVGMGASMYAYDSDDVLPVANRWMDLIDPYMKDESYFHCLRNDMSATDTPYEWVFRRRLGGKTRSLVEAPKETAMIFDSDVAFRNAAFELQAMPKGGIYRNGDYVCFADGHARFVPLARRGTLK